MKLGNLTNSQKGRFEVSYNPAIWREVYFTQNCPAGKRLTFYKAEAYRRCAPIRLGLSDKV
jgi:hypothetical protein